MLGSCCGGRHFSLENATDPPFGMKGQASSDDGQDYNGKVDEVVDNTHGIMKGDVGDEADGDQTRGR